MTLSVAEWQTAKDELARAREKRGLSQSDIARAANVTPRYISQIECGEAFPSEKVLRFYAREFGFDTDETDDLLFSWNRMPGDLARLLRENPLVRRRLRRELSAQS